MASFVYRDAKESMADGSFPGWTNITIRAMLIADTHTEDQDAHSFVSDVSADEISGAARQTLANALVRTEAGGIVELDGDDLVFSSVPSGETVAACILYEQVGGDDTTPGDDNLLVFVDGPDVATNGSDITVQLSADGAVQL